MKRLRLAWLATPILVLVLAQCDEPYDPGTTECGNNRVEAGEQCDGEAAAGFACADIGMGVGTVACTAECRWDFSGCTVAPTCGDDIRDAGEACDGSDVGGLQCADLGFDAGALGCLESCFFDLAGCCHDACDTFGETRCQEDVAETCTLQSSGCLDWGDAVDCTALSPAQVCDATGVGFGCTAPPCEDTCTIEGATRCEDATQIQGCARDAEGCLGWVDVLDCSANLPPQECDDAGGSAQCVTPCTDNCSTVGETRCVFGNQVLQTCDVQPSGCRDWSTTTDCTQALTNGVCDDSSGSAACHSCAQDCAAAGDSACNGDDLLECVERVPGCLEWQTVDDCTQYACGSCYYSFYWEAHVCNDQC